jgi:hypothetical protein
LKEHGKGFMKIEAPNFIFEVGDLVNAEEARRGWVHEKPDTHLGLITWICDEKDVVAIMFADCRVTRMADQCTLIHRYK